ncbi:MAG: hypothetical protein ACRDE5_04550, partial [Ginsengibacter sp.]
DRFSSLLKATPLSFDNNYFVLQMCSTLIKTKQPEQLHQLLFDKYNIEVPVMQHEDMTLLRYSIQGFNTAKDLDILYNALEEIIKTSSLIEL